MDYKIIPSVDGVDSIKINNDQLLGRGATGEVYKTQVGTKNYAVKLNHNINGFNHEKISYMIGHKPDPILFEKNNYLYPLYSWPLAIIYEGNKKPVGFVMPLIDETKSKTLEYFYDYTLSQRLNSSDSLALSFKVQILHNLCQSIMNLHNRGVLLIDLKPQNMRVFEGTNIVTLLDCDSFKIIDAQNKVLYPGEMVSPGYISPELLKSNLSVLQMTIAQDLYALAVIIFQVLNKGIHPFQGILVDANVAANTDDEKSAAGFYPYGNKANPVIYPKKESIHESFLSTTRALFDRAFIEGQKRPTAEEWANHFESIIKDRVIVRCRLFPNEIRHMHFKNMGCPTCKNMSSQPLQIRLANENINTSPNYQGKQIRNQGNLINSFSDVQHIYGITQPSYTESKSSGIMNMFYFLIGATCVVLLVIYFISNNNDIITGTNNSSNNLGSERPKQYENDSTYYNQENSATSLSSAKSKRKNKKHKVN